MSQGSPFDLLNDLTWPQQEAVTHFEGPLLILAGAGSGKTRVITRRVAWLLQQGVRASNILAITFTNKAAGEMRQRVNALVPGNRVWISTFHSLGARLLRQYGERIGLDRNFTIYDTDDRNKLVKQAMEAAGLDNVNFTPERVGGAISKAKNQLLTPERYAASGSDFFTTTVARVYPIYQKKLRDAQGMDFDDLLYVPALTLRLDEELRAELDARFKFVLIDEYQDTNSAQYEMARKLSIDHRNLCVVGDPDQSIYRWRGSDIRNILDFERDFPDARVITLDTNYRSTPAILRAAGAVIEHNQQRKKKVLRTDNPEGEPVRILTFDTGLDEGNLIAGRIKEAVAAGRYAYRDVAVFVRMNALTRTLETAFVKHGVPFQIVKGLAFFDRKENRDVLAYLRLLVNPADNLSFLRAVNEPARGIGKVSLDHLQAHAELNQIPLLEACGQVDRIPAIKGKARDGLRHFHRLMGELRGMTEQPPEDVIRAVLERSGYRAMLRDSTDDEDVDRLANVEELITSAKQFVAEDGSRTVRDFLEQITLASDVDAWDEKQDCVSVMTLHAAKGLEFPVVYMPAMEQGILPGERSLTREEDVEEERRVAFVGITRAMKELFLCHARLREFRGQTRYAIPSMFLEELPADVVTVDLGAHGGRSPSHDLWRGGSGAATAAWADTGHRPAAPLPPAVPRTVTVNPDAAGYEKGQIVQHDQYGIGTITEVSGYGALRKVRIRFAVGGEKTFIAEKVKLKAVTKRYPYTISTGPRTDTRSSMFILSAFADEISPDPQVQIDILKTCGVRHIEFRSIHKTNVLNLTDDQIADFKRLLDREGFKLSAIGSPIGKVRVDEPFAPHLEKFQRAIHLCRVFDTPNIRIFSYYPPDGFDGNWAPYRDQVMDRMRQKVEIAEREGIQLFHENEHRIYGDSPERLADLFATIKSKALKAAFDPANFVFCGYDPIQGWEVSKPHTAHFHIKDWKAGEEHGSIAGEGQGQIPKIIADAVRMGYSGFATLEPHLLGGGPTGGVTGPELFPKAVDAFRKIVEQAGGRCQ